MGGTKRWRRDSSTARISGNGRHADRLDQGYGRDLVLEVGLDQNPDILGCRTAPIGWKSVLGGTKWVSENADRLY